MLLLDNAQQLDEKTFFKMLFGAQSARRRAESYRGFRVGLSARCFQKGSLQEVFLRAANTKCNPEDDKVCAEMKVMSAAEKRGLVITEMVLIGNRQHDHGSGLMALTLHPCEECRKLMREHHRQGSGVITPETLVISFEPTDLQFQNFTLDKLMQMHGERW